MSTPSRASIPVGQQAVVTQSGQIGAGGTPYLSAQPFSPAVVAEENPRTVNSPPGATLAAVGLPAGSLDNRCVHESAIGLNFVPDSSFLAHAKPFTVGVVRGLRNTVRVAGMEGGLKWEGPRNSLLHRPEAHVAVSEVTKLPLLVMAGFSSEFERGVLRRFSSTAYYSSAGVASNEVRGIVLLSDEEV